MEKWKIKTYEFIGDTLISVKQLSSFVKRGDINSLLKRLSKLENKIRLQKKKIELQLNKSNLIF